MGSTDMSRKSTWLDPAGSIVSGVTGSNTLSKVMNPLTAVGATQKAGEYLDKSTIAAEEEAARQDELLKKMALGENPYLTTTDETLGVK